MISNISKLSKIAQLLDQNGKYAIADKVENLIKVSQNFMPNILTDAAPTGTPSFGHQLFDQSLREMGDTAVGSLFAGDGKQSMYGMASPYRSKFGPDSPALLPYITPKKLSELLKTEAGRKYVAQLQLSGALQAQNYQNLSNNPDFAKFVQMNLSSGVSQERKQIFLNSTLPGTITTQIANLLTNQPIYQWAPKLDEFYAVANSSGQYAAQIRSAINNAKKEALDNLKYHNPKYYQKIIKDPKYNEFMNKIS